MNLTIIIGARPQFIKAAMVSRAIADHNQHAGCDQIKETAIHTGLHYDQNMRDHHRPGVSIHGVGRLIGPNP